MDPKFLRNQKYAKKGASSKTPVHGKNRVKGKTDHFGNPA